MVPHHGGGPLIYIVKYFDQEVEGDTGVEKSTEVLHLH
jgi:hypothetical protein